MSTEKEYQILIADDQPDNVFLLEMLLKKQPNFNSVSVDNGQLAVDYVNENSVDLVLMDIMMPVLDGIEATRIIREKFEFVDLPIIMVTTLNDTEHIVRSFEAGASDYVSKPIEWNALKARISSCLQVSDYAKRERALLQNMEKLNQRLKQFSFSVAHDIRNPLAHIRVLCDALKEKILSEGEVIPQIDELAEKAYTFLDGILQHSAYGKSEEVSDVDLHKVSEEVVKFLGASIKENKGEVVINDLPTLKGEYSLYFQLILNLVGNAIKYRHPDRDPVIEISHEVKDGMVVVSIKDNCRGIAADDMEEIKKPLTRGKSSEGTSGSGLGLSLTKNILEEYEGDMDISSKEGDGTLVQLKFPEKLKSD